MTDRTCGIEECGSKHYQGGWCIMHFRRWQTHGDPLKTLINRGAGLRWLRDLVADPGSDCAPWPFGKHTTGYGTVIHDGRQQVATHVSLILSGHPRPDAPGNQALHSCDNPPCVNPRHLRWGTVSDNMRDMVERGRYRVVRGEGHSRHKLTESRVEMVRKLRSEGWLQREIAEQFGMTQSAISKVLLGHTWFDPQDCPTCDGTGSIA